MHIRHLILIQAGVKGGLNVCEDPVTKIEQLATYNVAVHLLVVIIVKMIGTLDSQSYTYCIHTYTKIMNTSLVLVYNTLYLATCSYVTAIHLVKVIIEIKLKIYKLKYIAS